MPVIVFHRNVRRANCRRVQPGSGALVAAIFSITVSAAAMAQSNPAAIASAPIDPAIFRDGEVRRLTGAFGVWNVVCDEVIRQSRRYCSLKAQLTGQESRAHITISTGDDGRPAAILLVPHGIVLSRPIVLRFAAGASPKTLANRASPQHLILYQRPLRMLNCSREACQIVWTLHPAELMHLRRGDHLSLGYFIWRRQKGISATLDDPRTHAGSTLGVTGKGFAEAVQAALK